MKPGDAAELTRTFHAADLDDYLALGGAVADRGARPGDDHAADGVPVPGALINALFSCLLGMQLPGLGTNYLKQETRWLQAASLGEPLTARVEIVRLQPEKQLVDLTTSCRDSAGNLLASGRALVRCPG